MATIKEIRDNASSIATANPNINGFLFGFQEDFNNQRSTLSYPLLMFQKFTSGNSMVNYKKEQAKDQRWQVVLFMSHKLVAGEDIEEKQEEMQAYMEEFLEAFLSTNGYHLASDVAPQYYERFMNNADVGVRYEFTLATQDCFGN
jgi:hypothetical protein